MRLNEEKKKHAENIVMVVDDDPAVRLKIRKILSATHRIIDALDLSIISNAYQQYLPNVVIMDAAASLANGRDLIKEILEYDPEAFIIVISDNPTQQNILHSKERGAKAFLPKPLKHETVLKYVSLAKVPAKPGSKPFSK